MIEIIDEIIVEKRTIKCGNPIEFEKYFVNRLRELSQKNDILFNDRLVSMNTIVPHQYEIEYRKR